MQTPELIYRDVSQFSGEMELTANLGCGTAGDRQELS